MYIYLSTYLSIYLSISIYTYILSNSGMGTVTMPTCEQGTEIYIYIYIYICKDYI